VTVGNEKVSHSTVTKFETKEGVPSARAPSIFDTCTFIYYIKAIMNLIRDRKNEFGRHRTPKNGKMRLTLTEVQERSRKTKNDHLIM
jgi:hypothetical protein